LRLYADGNDAVRPRYGMLAGAYVAMILACASGRMAPATAPPASASSSPSVMPPGTHDQIASLSRAIDEQRRQLKLPEPAPLAPMADPVAMEPVVACLAAPPTEACHDVCTLADSICGNATKICDLAKQMAGDDWAKGKCDSATKTCGESHERCCSCT
jgi:hypothetical protein